MLSLDEAPDTGQKGLTFVKKQFLPRTGIQYVDLVELLKTRFINPNFPQGKALTLLESIRFSYRFLQTLVDTSSTDPKIRFAKLIAFLESLAALGAAIDAMLHPDPCHQHKRGLCAEIAGFSELGLLLLRADRKTDRPRIGRRAAAADLKARYSYSNDRSLPLSGIRLAHCTRTERSQDNGRSSSSANVTLDGDGR